MSYNATIRAMQAAQRREERAAQKRFRELERRTKEQAKLSALEQARLEVERYESELEVLLSVHKERGDVWDWLALAASLPPHAPRKWARRELKARHQAELASLRSSNEQSFDSILAEALSADEQEFQEASRSFSEQQAEWQRLNDLAPRILAGEHKAYTEALTEFNPFAELADLGSSIYFIIHHARLVECVLKVKGRQAIPAEVKSLTASGKVSVKAMPKARFHELYQDYVCGCVLRVTREVIALLPVDAVLVTASVDALDSRTGQPIAQPVLSVATSRTELDRLDFTGLDPSDAIENFLHRGDFKASRKSGDFVGIAPLTPPDLPQSSAEPTDVRDSVSTLQRLRGELRAELQTLTRASIAQPA